MISLRDKRLIRLPAYESFFAFAPTPNGNPAKGAIYKADVVNFVSACPEVASSLVYLRTGKVSESGELDKSAPTSTLSQVRSHTIVLHGVTHATCRWSSGASTPTALSRNIKPGRRIFKHGPRHQPALTTRT